MLQRLANFCSDVSGFELTTKYCAHVKHVFPEGKSTFTAGRLELLFMALCFVLRDLIDPELRLIEQAICDGKVDKGTDSDGKFPEPPDNPCPDIIRALACFLDWYMMARLLMFSMDEAPELQRRAFVMKEVLQEVFPDKAGQIAAWNFPKMHMPEHIVTQILLFATILFTNTNMFEAGHMPNIKDLSGNSNGKDQFTTISKFHDRASNISLLKQAASRHRNDSGSSSDDSDDADDDIFADPITTFTSL